jgi:CheY-like chemotaxis protein
METEWGFVAIGVTLAVLLTALSVLIFFWLARYVGWMKSSASKQNPQRIVLGLGLLLVILNGLFPRFEWTAWNQDKGWSYHQEGYRFLFAPPVGSKIIFTPFLVQIVTIIAATAGAFFLFGMRDKKGTAQGNVQGASKKFAETVLNNGGGDAPVVEKSTPIQSRRTRPPRIVVVDDEPIMLDMVELQIRDWFKEATVLKFQEGNAAWQELLQIEPDLLITDWVHPGLTGADMFSRLAEKKARYPILVTSGFAKENHLRDYVSRSLNVTLLSKPYTKEQFNRELLVHVGAKTNDRG